MDTFENVDTFDHLPKPQDWHTYSKFQKRKYLSALEIDRVLAEDPEYSIETSVPPINWDTLSSNAQKQFRLKLNRRKEVLSARCVRYDAKQDLKEKLEQQAIDPKSLTKNQRKRLLRRFERSHISGESTDTINLINHPPTPTRVAQDLKNPNNSRLTKNQRKKLLRRQENNQSIGEGAEPIDNTTNLLQIEQDLQVPVDSQRLELVSPLPEQPQIRDDLQIEVDPQRLALVSPLPDPPQIGDNSQIPNNLRLTKNKRKKLLRKLENNQSIEEGTDLRDIINNTTNPLQIRQVLQVPVDSQRLELVSPLPDPPQIRDDLQIPNNPPLSRRQRKRLRKIEEFLNSGKGIDPRAITNNTTNRLQISQDLQIPYNHQPSAFKPHFSNPTQLGPDSQIPYNHQPVAFDPFYPKPTQIRPDLQIPFNPQPLSSVAPLPLTAENLGAIFGNTVPSQPSTQQSKHGQEFMPKPKQPANMNININLKNQQKSAASNLRNVPDSELGPKHSKSN